MAQGLLQLPTTGIVSGLQNNQDANAALAALATMVQGGSAPTPASTGLAATSGVLWHDTTNSLLKLRDQADTTWMTLAQVSESAKTVTPLLFGQQFYFWMRGYLAGLTLSNDASAPNTTIDISPGIAVTDDQLAILDTTITFTKTTAAWAAGTGNGALDTGSAAASTWYHVFIIFNSTSGALDFLLSTSATAPALPSGWTNKRRLGAIKTDGSGNILPFSQNGDEFLWSTMVTDVSGTIGTSASTQTLASVPLGVKVNALVRVAISNSGIGAALLTSLDESDQAPSGTRASLRMGSSGVGADCQLAVRTNISQQIRARADTATTTLTVSTYGWIDNRGRNT